MEIALYEILIVDDSQTNVHFCKSLLERDTAYKIRCFHEPFDVLQALQESTFDLALIDFHMPQMNGIELIRAIRRLAHCQHQPIIMLTSDAEQETLYEAFKAGANDYLKRPFDHKEFFARVHNLLGLWEKHRKLESYAHKLQEKIIRTAKKT